MKKIEAIEVLGKVKAIWYQQPTDDLVQNEWAEALSAISFPAGIEAVRLYRDSGQDMPPTPGQIRAEGLRVDDRIRAEHRALPPPPISETEREANLRMLRECVERLTEGWSMEKKLRLLGPR